MTFIDLSPQEYAGMSARQMARQVAGRRISPVHLVEHALTLAKAAEPDINAYVTFLENDAHAAATAAERQARAGRLRGPLHGVAMTVISPASTRSLMTTSIFL